MVTLRLPCFSIVVVTVLFAGVVAPAAETAEKNVAMAPDTLLKNLNDAQRAFANVHTKCVWYSRQAANVTSQEQDFFLDDLGRRRIVSHFTPVSAPQQSADKERDCVSNVIYDGEIMSYSKSYPHLNRIGQDPESPDAEDKALGYNPVIIGDAASSLRSAMEQERNPFEYVRNAAIPAMTEAVKRRQLSVSPVDEAGMIRAEIAYEHVGTDGIAKSVIEINPERQWLITTMKGYSIAGACINDITFEYREQADGLWAPREGRHRIWNPDSAESEPILDWRCDVLEAKLNDPAFDASVFTIMLMPDAAVSDTRYNITYRVGAQEANTARMQSYISDAIEQRNFESPLGNAKVVTSSATWRGAFYTVNALLLLVCAGVYTFFVARKRRTA